MLIHSVTPAHMLIEQPEIPQVSYKQMGGSYLEGTETPQGFRVSRVLSTDPTMYLRGDLAPGSLYRG